MKLMTLSVPFIYIISVIGEVFSWKEVHYFGKIQVIFKKKNKKRPRRLTAVERKGNTRQGEGLQKSMLHCRSSGKFPRNAQFLEKPELLLIGWLKTCTQFAWVIGSSMLATSSPSLFFLRDQSALRETHERRKWPPSSRKNKRLLAVYIRRTFRFFFANLS